MSAEGTPLPEPPPFGLPPIPHSSSPIDFQEPGYSPNSSNTDNSSAEPAEARAEEQHYHAALSSIRHAIDQIEGCSVEEKNALKQELIDLEQLLQKLEEGRVEIVLFGEIDTGKSALINALVGQTITEVDVRGGWTKEVWRVPWTGAGYCVPGYEKSQIVLLDTPGINEVGGTDRAAMARDAAARADLILFVTDSDLNQLEFAALAELVSLQKPVILVFNKVDNYTGEQRQRLREVLCGERLVGMLGPENFIETAADPLPREYIIEAPNGSQRVEHRQPPPNVEGLKARILEVLNRDGKSLLALNAAMYAADRSDRISAMKVKMRDDWANAVIWSYAATKSMVVALTVIPVADVIGGSAVDVTMVLTLARIYGIQLTWNNARKLIESILKAAGWMVAAEAMTHLAASVWNVFTLGSGKVLTALPQGAAAGYGSYIVGQAAKYYFEHGGSWGAEAPKTVITRILETTDKESVLKRLQAEIKTRLKLNLHARGGKK